MPERIKVDKITFSDLQTPQEKSKLPELKAKQNDIQGFSDLFPIVEETHKNRPSDLTDDVILGMGDSDVEMEFRTVHSGDQYEGNELKHLSSCQTSSHILETNTAELKNPISKDTTTVSKSSSQTSLITVKRKPHDKVKNIV